MTLFDIILRWFPLRTYWLGTTLRIGDALFPNAEVPLKSCIPQLTVGRTPQRKTFQFELLELAPSFRGTFWIHGGDQHRICQQTGKANYSNWTSVIWILNVPSHVRQTPCGTPLSGHGSKANYSNWNLPPKADSIPIQVTQFGPLLWKAAFRNL